MKKLIDLIVAFQQLNFVIKTRTQSVLFVYCDKKSIRHDFRVREKYAGVVQLIFEACGYEALWDNDEVCKIRDSKQYIRPILIKEYYNSHSHCTLTTSDRLLDYISHRGNSKFTVWTVDDEPIIDLS